MTAYNFTADRGSVGVTAFGTSYDRSILAISDTVAVSGGAATLIQGETSTTIRWALVAIELEAHTKGGLIRLQQEAKK